jgi:hypothetical protein
MANSLTLINNQTLLSNTTTVTFTGLPQVYRDLVLVCTYANVSGGDQPTLIFNGDTGSNYSLVGVAGYSTSSVASWSYTSTNIHPMNYTGISAGETGLWKVDILDYSATDKHKTVLSRSNHTGEVDMNAARWTNTAAIISLTITSSLVLAAGSTFYLYGVTA